MAWAHVGSTNATGSSASPTVARPAGIATGQLLWAVVFSANPILQWPAGWTQDGRFINAGNSYTAWGHKLAQSAEPATYVWAMTSGVWNVLLDSFSGVTIDPSDVLEAAQPFGVSATGTTIALPRPVASLAGDLAIYACDGFSSTSTITIASATLLQNVFGCATAFENIAAAGQIAARTFTYGATTTFRDCVTALYSGNAVATPAVHTLSGTGVQAISAPVGISISLAGVGSSQPIVLGNPTRYFGLGNIAWGDANGYTRNYFLEHTSELIIAPWSSCTLLGYSFHPGITATVTELNIL